MKKIIALSVLSVLGLGSLKAQTVDDVYNISTPQLQGDARYLATGGAFGALGGNMYSIGTNPAGLGVFINNEFSISLGFPLAIGNSVGGSPGNASSAQLTIPNIGIVGQISVPKSQLKGFNIAITHNRVVDYYKSYTINDKSEHSLADFFVDQANGIYTSDFNVEPNFAPLPFTSYLAYNAFLINPITNNDTNLYFHPYEGEIANQQIRYKQRGAQSETNIAGGLNFMDKFYLGFGIGIARINYNYTKTHSEVFDENQYLGSFDYQTELNIDGFGFNAKLGGIMRINESLRVGVFYHTPSVFNVEDTYFASVRHDEEALNSEDNASIESVFSYRYVQSGKVGFSGAFILNKRGFLSFDYTYSPLNNNRYKNTSSVFATDAEKNADFSGLNNNVFDVLQPIHTAALGFEYKFGALALRLGYRYQTVAFSSNFALNYTPSNTFSGGLGYRNNNFFIDGALAINTSSENNILYDLSDRGIRTPDYRVNYTRLNLTGTIGFNF